MWPYLCTWEVEAGGSDVQGHPWWLPSEFEAVLGYMRAYLKKKKASQLMRTTTKPLDALCNVFFQQGRQPQSNIRPASAAAGWDLRPFQPYCEAPPLPRPPDNGARPQNAIAVNRSRWEWDIVGFYSFMARGGLSRGWRPGLLQVENGLHQCSERSCLPVRTQEEQEVSSFCSNE